MKFKVGDKVRVRTDLKEGWRYYMADKKESNVLATPMSKLKGQVVTISKIIDHQYAIKECANAGIGVFRWVDEMFESEPIKSFDRKKIVITTDGTETHARLYEENKLVKTATAKCSPEDTFDFAAGARIAFSRLFEEGEATKPRIEVGKYYKCVDPILPCDGIIKVTAKDGTEYSYVAVEGMEGDTARHRFYADSLFESFLTPMPIDYKPEPKYYNGKVVCTYKGVDAYGYTVGKIYEFIDGTVVDDDGDVRYKLHPVSNISELRLVKFIPLVE